MTFQDPLLTLCDKLCILAHHVSELPWPTLWRCVLGHVMTDIMFILMDIVK